jgi:transposase
LLAEPGVGPVVAAQLLVSWSHRGRVRNEAAFASLAGVAPLEASSGQRTRHRLSRMGDRSLCECRGWLVWDWLVRMVPVALPGV